MRYNNFFDAIKVAAFHVGQPILFPLKWVKSCFDGTLYVNLVVLKVLIFALATGVAFCIVMGVPLDEVIAGLRFGELTFVRPTSVPEGMGNALRGIPLVFFVVMVLSVPRFIVQEWIILVED